MDRPFRPQATCAGGDLMGSLLPCRPKPRPDELLSSWLIRLADMYRMRLRDFMQFLGIAWHFHSSDIDRLAPEPLLARNTPR